MRFLPRWRPFTWFLLLVNAAALAYVIATGVTAEPQGVAEEAAAGAAIGLLIALWIAADVILGLVWLITKPKTRDCPRCGYDVKRGTMVCRKCGYDFAAATRQPPAAAAPPDQPA